MNGITVSQAGICQSAANLRAADTYAPKLHALKPNQPAIARTGRTRSWMPVARACTSFARPVAVPAAALHLAAEARVARIAPPAAAVAPAPRRFPVLFRSSRS